MLLYALFDVFGFTPSTLSRRHNYHYFYKSLIKIIEFAIKACLCLNSHIDICLNDYAIANYVFLCVNATYSMYVTTPKVHMSVGKETKSKFTTSGAKNSGVPKETLSFSRGLYLKRDK